MSAKPIHSWRESLKALLHPRVLTMLFLGFSAGLPLLLIFSSLSLWLNEADIERSTITYFSWAALGYSFKFVWAPLVDRLPLPWLTRRLGRRRGWLLLAQSLIASAIVLMALVDPALSPQHLNLMACAAVLLGFSAATQDIVIDAYRIESAEVELQGLMSSSYIAGYRIGMITSGAGALFLASGLGSKLGDYNYGAWSLTYLIMATTMLVGITTTLLMPEPASSSGAADGHSRRDYLQLLALFVCAVSGFIACYLITSDLAQSLKDYWATSFGNTVLANLLVEFLRLIAACLICISIAITGIRLHWVNPEMVKITYVAPVRDFFSRYGIKTALLLLTLIGLYRISDIVLGAISNVFYQDLGFNKNEIAGVVKTFGILMAIAGSYLGGILAMHYGVMRILFLGAVLAAGTNLLFMWLADVGYNMPLLYLVISADNLSAGLASAAFVAFLSSLTNISFTAMQYAIFSSLMTLLPKVMGGYSGSIVDNLGYSNFFIITALIGLPVLWLIVLARNTFTLAPERS